jgi:c-di-GMP-related signal transduction protein
MDIWLARQPIFDRQQQVVGYELLCRCSPHNAFTHPDPDRASSQVITDSLFAFGLDWLTAGKRAFINVTRHLLVQQLTTLLPATHVVVELLETIEPDAEVIAACRALKQAGYWLALDDFVFHPAFEPLLALADIIKLDFRATTEAQRQEIVARIAPYKVQFLAEKVETRADVMEARKLGCAYFQGYFFCQPEMVAGRDIPKGKLHLLEFLHELSRPEVNFDQLEQLLKPEVALCVKLLRYLNSAALGRRHRVTSLKQALVLLGERQLKQWAALIALTDLGREQPAELVVTCLSRARLCELIAADMGWGEQGFDYYLTGLLSTLDALLDRPMAEILAQLAVSPAIQLALLNGDGRLGEVYRLVRSYERGDWEQVGATVAQLGMAGERLPTLYGQAVRWADQLTRGERLCA